MPIATVQIQVPAVVAGKIVTARAGRRQLVLTVLSDGIDIFIGDSTCTKDNGLMLLGVAGYQSPVLETTAEVWACTAAGVGKVSFIEVFDT
jgi:hypothetical protein